ncbi:amidohydrolase family protein [Bifidobacterium sp. MA2]|uniref:Amidohydrolase family protein n=1 Tax=Bifidobacterium santillanense TaxID=2809028 RepID=A0ABS5URK2_9BIFI|nr:dihydroorotase [Bifidobacterium santillanense]MBT1173389.1 amidohydrolase family protein [Bifidobacterium santillanense]
MLTLRNIKVWDTDEIIDLKVPADGTLFEDGARGADGSAVSGDVEIDATGLTLAPGFADPHVHFRDPGQTYKESMVSGCAAAASGGYTDVLIMPNTVPAMDGETIADPGAPGAREVLDAGYDSVIDYLQHYGAAHDVTLPVRYDLCVCASKGRAGREATDLEHWRRYMPGVDDGSKDTYQLAHPVTAISDDGSAVTPEILDDVFALAKASGLTLIEHCEHHDTGAVNEGPVSRELNVPGIPEDTELKVVARDIAKARETGVHVHFQHVSTAISFEAIRAAKAEGLPITCETAPHYLALSDEALLEYGTLAKMNPPLRSEADRKATVAAIADGTVDLLATDHAPHTMEEKALGFLEAPNGIIGLECAYGVCHSRLVDGGFISDKRLIELMSVEPMRLMGHEPTDVTALLDRETDASQEPDAKRVLDLSAVRDETADGIGLVVLDTAAEWTVDPERFHSKARNTPFGGWKVTGLPLATIIGRNLAFSRL